MLTIKELKEKLSQYSDDLRILVDGYEGGFSEISAVKKIKVKLNVHSESYYGPHDETKDADVDVVVIHRSQG
jgi:hypothetical protein